MRERHVYSREIENFFFEIKNGKREFDFTRPITELFLMEILSPHLLREMPNIPGFTVSIRSIKANIGHNTAKCRVNLHLGPLINTHFEYTLSNSQDGVLNISNIKVPTGRLAHLAEPIINSLPLDNLNPLIIASLQSHGVRMNFLSAHIINGLIRVKFG